MRTMVSKAESERKRRGVKEKVGRSVSVCPSVCPTCVGETDGHRAMASTADA